MKHLRAWAGPLVALLAALLVGAAIVAAVGDDPVYTYRLMIESALSWPDGIAYTLFYATPLVFTGLAVAVALRCGLLNIGAEGQLIVAALAAAAAGGRLEGVTAWLAIPLSCLAAIAAGALWGAIPGVLKARFGAHEVINTIMMNFVAAGLASALTQSFLRAPGDMLLETRPIAASAHIARLGTVVPGLPARLPVNAAFLLAVAACVLVWWFLKRTAWGYEIRATGMSPMAAEYGGVPVRSRIVLAMAISGGLAGLVGVNEVLGYRYRYFQGFSPNYGFTGIAVALLGRNHPGGVLLAALFFGALMRGGLFVDIFTEHVSKDLVVVIQGLVILFVAAESFFAAALRKRERAD